jgi:DNA excision repair protein ERCC-5
MLDETKQLLQLFGLPYVTAPMEAEAQCAALEQLGLVDGVITDDADVFLFGGQNVYKNIFEKQRFVESYRMADVERELGCDREALVRLALLLGSDYTLGVRGIGVVNALEVLARGLTHGFRGFT